VKRPLFNPLPALSLLACAGVAVLWVRSWLPEDMRCGVVDGTAVLVFSRGEHTARADRMYFASGPQVEAEGGGYYPAGIGLRGFLRRLRSTGQAFPPLSNPASGPPPGVSTGRVLGVIWVASADGAPARAACAVM